MFFLSHEWQDPEDGIEAVLLHWQVTLLEQAPNWRRTHAQTVLAPQPASAPIRRRGALWITPPFSRKSLSADEGAPPLRFLLHSFCEVVQRGRAWNADVISQEIRSVTVAHVDPSAECTHAMLYYSLDNLAHVNCVPMVADGLSARSSQRGALPAESITKKERKARMMRAKRLAQAPTPHTFYGQLWGPAGGRSFYAVHLRRDGAYNPFSERGFWLLPDGGFWEVTF